MQVKLPRQLVNQLLHQAQLAADKTIYGLITQDYQNQLHCHPIKKLDVMSDKLFTIDIDAQFAKLSKTIMRDDKLFAVYYSRNNKQSQQNVFKYTPASLMHFIISLETKGILEITAFYSVNEVMKNIELEIYD